MPLSTTKAADLDAWRQWLRQHHACADGVWLQLAKQASGIASVSIQDAIDEALCWGWIDSLPNKIDEAWYKVRFNPRNPKSTWSARNKDIVAVMTAASRMQPSGLAMIELAKETGTWTALDKVEALICPMEMVQLLHHNDLARQNWEAFPKSTKRGILEWIYAAKRAVTTSQRIKKTVDMAARNQRANQYSRGK